MMPRWWWHRESMPWYGTMIGPFMVLIVAFLIVLGGVSWLRII